MSMNSVMTYAPRSVLTFLQNVLCEEYRYLQNDICEFIAVAFVSCEATCATVRHTNCQSNIHLCAINLAVLDCCVFFKCLLQEREIIKVTDHNC